MLRLAGKIGQKLKSQGSLPAFLHGNHGFAVLVSWGHNQPAIFRERKTNLKIASFIVTVLMVFATHCNAAFLDKEVSFSETEIQAATDKSKPQQLNYGGLLTVSLSAPPKLTLG